MEESIISIEIAYGDAKRQHIEVLSVPLGTTVQQALEQSTELKKKFPEMEIHANHIGIFAKHVSMDTILEQDNRIEIYRPLIIDPKLARRLRADKSKQSPES